MSDFRTQTNADVAETKAKKKTGWEAGYRLGLAQARAEKARRMAEAERWIETVRARKRR